MLAQQSPSAKRIVSIGGVAVGGPDLVLIAGPCAVEDRETLLTTARAVKAAGAHLLRGGAYKPRTSPYSFQGLGQAGLELLAEARAETGLPVVTEVLDTADVPLVAAYADALQIGARNMQNTALLRAVGRSGKPVLLKRHFAATIEEWLSAAEYILGEGNENVVLVERGIRSFETMTRFTLDLTAIPLIKRLTPLPVLADPSHGTGRSELVPDMSRAAVAAGADGLMLEVHPRPEVALSDGRQTLDLPAFAALVPTLERVAAAVGRDAQRISM